MATRVRFELTASWVKVKCSTFELSGIMAGMERFELSTLGFGDRYSTTWATFLYNGCRNGAWTHIVLLMRKLNYHCIDSALWRRGRDSNPYAELTTTPLSRRAPYHWESPLHNMATEVRFELTTTWVKVKCSTFELLGIIKWCRWRDLNPYESLPWLLKPLCLPFHHICIWRSVRDSNPHRLLSYAGFQDQSLSQLE